LSLLDLISILKVYSTDKTLSILYYRYPNDTKYHVVSEVYPIKTNQLMLTFFPKFDGKPQTTGSMLCCGQILVEGNSHVAS